MEERYYKLLTQDGWPKEFFTAGKVYSENDVPSETTVSRLVDLWPSEWQEVTKDGQPIVKPIQVVGTGGAGTQPEKSLTEDEYSGLIAILQEIEFPIGEAIAMLKLQSWANKHNIKLPKI